MDFTFNETQLEVQQLANKILSEMETTERLNVIDQQESRFDQPLWQALAEAGLLGVAFNENNGGMGFGFTELCLFIEEIGRTVAAAPVIPVIVSAALPVQAFGSKEQQQRFLPGIAAGKQFITSALSEPSGDNLTDCQTQAIKTAKGYALTGTKMAVAFADKAERLVVSARADDAIGLFLLDPCSPGVTLNEQASTAHESWFELIMHNAQVDADDVIVIDTKAVIWTEQHTIAALCAMQTGIADKSLRMTAEFTCERVQFDVPIGSFQAVQHRAADCFIDITCLRLTTYQAVSLLDLGHDATNEVLIAKIWAGDTGHRVSYAAQHLHGGTGIDKDYHLWRYCLFARQNEMLLGSSAALLQALGKRIAQGDAFAE